MNEMRKSACGIKPVCANLKFMTIISAIIV